MGIMQDGKSLALSADIVTFSRTRSLEAHISLKRWIPTVLIDIKAMVKMLFGL